MVAAVMDALDGAEGITVECRAMLKAACQMALGFPKEERHATQQSVVGMIGEVLGGSASRLEAAESALALRIAGLEAKKVELEAAAQLAEDSARAADEALELRGSEAESASIAASEADEICRQRAETQKEGDKHVSVLEKEKVDLEKILEQHLAPVQLGDESAEHAGALQVLGESLGLEEALLVSLPKACMKPKASRGSFDEMVLESLADVLRSNAVRLQEKIEAEGPGIRARAEAVSEAACAKDAKAEVQQQCNTALQAALATKETCQSSLQEAKTAVLFAEVEIEKASKERDIAQAAVRDFTDGPLSCFSELKHKVAATETAEVAEAAEVAGA